MARVIVITSGKGGVGKSTICCNLGIALANLNQKVCLIDADLGLKNLDVMMGLENRVIYDLDDVLKGKCSIEKAIIRDKRKKQLYLLPTCKSLDVQNFDSNTFKLVVDELRVLFDFILIDCPAGIEKGFYNAINCSEEAIVVVNKEKTSIRDADKVIGILQKQNIGNMKLIINRYLPNQNDLDIEDIKMYLAIDVLGWVYEDENMSKYINEGKPIAFDENNLTSKCFEAFALNLLGKKFEMPKYRKKNILSQLIKL